LLFASFLEKHNIFLSITLPKQTSSGKSYNVCACRCLCRCTSS